MSKDKALTVGMLAPDFELVRGVPPERQVGSQAGPSGLPDAQSTAAGPTVVTLAQQRAHGHVVLYFMRAFY